MKRRTTWVWMRLYEVIMEIASMDEVRILVGKCYLLRLRNNTIDSVVMFA